MTSLTMNDFTTTAPQSVLSFSEESLSSGEDLSTSDLGLGGRQQDYRQLLQPGSTAVDGYLLDGVDGNFRL